MIVTIQQPEHLPWMGFFDKMRRSDLYIYLDNVQYKKRYFENRNKILTANGPQFITVPVKTKGKYTQKINEVCIDNSIDWQNKYLGSIQRAYSKASFFQPFFSALEEVINKTYERLIDLNLDLINIARDYLKIDTDTCLASELQNSEDITGSDLILDLCIRSKAKTNILDPTGFLENRSEALPQAARIKSPNTNTFRYISGPDGKNYLDLNKFKENDIKVVYHDYDHPTYKQLYNTGFVSHMSIIDYIFNNESCSYGQKS